MTNDLASPVYRTFLESIKERVRAAQVQAVVAVNHELVLLNWEIRRTGAGAGHIFTRRAS